MNSQKITESKTFQIAGITLTICIVIITVALAISELTKPEPDSPSENIINKTCEEHGMKSQGYTINFKDNKRYINCQIEYTGE